METFCTVIFTPSVWGVECKHSNKGQNFSSKMRYWVTDPASQTGCRWETSDSTTGFQGNVDNRTSTYPDADFLPRRMGYLVNSLHDHSAPEDEASIDWRAPNKGFEASGWCILLLGKGDFEGLSQVHSVIFIQKSLRNTQLLCSRQTHRL